MYKEMKITFNSPVIQNTLFKSAGQPALNNIGYGNTDQAEQIQIMKEQSLINNMILEQEQNMINNMKNVSQQNIDDIVQLQQSIINLIQLQQNIINNKINILISQNK